VRLEISGQGRWREDDTYLAIEPAGLSSTQKELRSVGVGAGCEKNGKEKN